MSKAEMEAKLRCTTPEEECEASGVGAIPEDHAGDPNFIGDDDVGDLLLTPGRVSMRSRSREMRRRRQTTNFNGGDFDEERD